MLWYCGVEGGKKRVEFVRFEKVSELDMRFHRRSNTAELICSMVGVCPFCSSKVSIRVIGDDFRVLEWCRHFEGVFVCECRPLGIYGVFVRF